MSERESEFEFTTRSIHSGECPDASAMPIFQAATVSGSYSRDGHNPTVEAFEEKVRDLEGGRVALATASGMAAISQTLMALLKTGDRLVAHQTMYSGVQRLLKEWLPRYGFDVCQIDMRDPDQVADALKVPTQVVYFEPIANPFVEVLDAPKLIDVARQAGATVLVDNTFLTPYLFQPLRAGADIVVHSATKFLCGHGDTLGGVIVTQSEKLGTRILKARHYFGGILSPMNAFLLLRGIKTLPMRMDRHCENAMQVAAFLDIHPEVTQAYYPGLPSSPGYEIACSYLEHFGGMLNFETSFDLDWDDMKTRFRLIKPRVSLGDATTLITPRGPRRLRLSVGLEDPGDIAQDLERAFGCA